MNLQKRKIGDLWEVQEGTKKVWKVQFPHGILSFYTKKIAIKWSEELIREYG